MECGIADIGIHGQGQWYASGSGRIDEAERQIEPGEGPYPKREREMRTAWRITRG